VEGRNEVFRMWRRKRNRIVSRLILPYPKEEELILNLMKYSGDLFIDIGACKGAYSINLADNFSEVWAIEPSTFYCGILENNIRQFNKQNIKLIKKAISDKIGQSILYGNPRMFQNETTSPSLKQNYIFTPTGNINLPLELEIVETTTIAELLKNRTANLIKVDTEGNEKQILKGAETVMSQIKIWQIEVHNWGEIKEVENMLSSYNYEIEEKGSGWGERGWIIARIKEGERK